MSVNPNKPVKSILIGTVASLITILILLSASAGILTMLPTIPKGALPYLMLIVCAVGALIGGYITAAIAGAKGLIMGFLCGICSFLCLLIIGLLTVNSDIGTVTFIRLGVMTLFGMLGGIKGVNRKEKLRIK